MNCDSKYYNFKTHKMEVCPNRDKCSLFKNWDNSSERWELPIIKFRFIKDFRTCKRY